MKQARKWKSVEASAITSMSVNGKKYDINYANMIQIPADTMSQKQSRHEMKLQEDLLRQKGTGSTRGRKSCD